MKYKIYGKESENKEKYIATLDKLNKANNNLIPYN